MCVAGGSTHQMHAITHVSRYTLNRDILPQPTRLQRQFWHLLFRHRLPCTSSRLERAVHPSTWRCMQYTHACTRQCTHHSQYMRTVCIPRNDNNQRRKAHLVLPVHEYLHTRDCKYIHTDTKTCVRMRTHTALHANLVMQFLCGGGLSRHRISCMFLDLHRTCIAMQSQESASHPSIATLLIGFLPPPPGGVRGCTATGAGSSTAAACRRRAATATCSLNSSQCRCSGQWLLHPACCERRNGILGAHVLLRRQAANSGVGLHRECKWT